MAVATYTDQEMLDRVRATIYALVEGGASSRTSFGRTWTAADLDTLRKLEEEYVAKVAGPKSRTNLGRFREPS